ncbi:uncharacterized protein LOC115323663 [Ixodes scapularis]|uniref:uncharacterized protein LOC115323663 n=1 Tax=Ixodes scapularis TaxID=6945 RepID=UPI001C385DCC|nr:uncharacterized protein LOC115323663 [Ixodes scapularis]
MFAYVRYEQEGQRAILPVSLIKEKENRPFCAVEFVGDDSVAAVPTAWLNADKTMCSWPKNVPPASVIKLAQSQAPPGNEEEWPLHPVRVFSYCKTYKKAKRKATEDLENSCLESTDVGEPDDGATGKDNTADAPLRLSVPIPPTGPGGACARAPPKRRAPDPPSSKGWSKESRAPTSPLAERQAPRRRNLEAAEVVEATMSPFQSELLKVVLDVRHEVHLLRQDTAQVLANQEQLAVRIAQLERANCPPDAPVPPAVFILPLATMVDFEAAERRLINPADQAVLKEQLSGLGGTTIAEAVRRTLERLLRKHVQMHFSICGRRGNKRPFRGTQLCAVAVAIIRSRVGGSVVDVERAIGDYLSGAPDREGGRAERMAKKIQDAAILSAQFVTVLPSSLPEGDFDVHADILDSSQT